MVMVVLVLVVVTLTMMVTRQCIASRLLQRTTAGAIAGAVVTVALAAKLAAAAALSPMLEARRMSGCTLATATTALATAAPMVVVVVGAAVIVLLAHAPRALALVLRLSIAAFVHTLTLGVLVQLAVVSADTLADLDGATRCHRSSSAPPRHTLVEVVHRARRSCSPFSRS